MQKSCKLFIQNMCLQAHIGVYDHEHQKSQPVRITLELDLGDFAMPQNDTLEETVNYKTIHQNVEAVVKDGHTYLVETLAERIAMTCLDHDSRLRAVMVRLEKPYALDGSETAGVELTVQRSDEETKDQA